MVLLGLVLPFFQMPNLPKRAVGTPTPATAGGGRKHPESTVGNTRLVTVFSAQLFYLFIVVVIAAVSTKK